MKTQDGYDWPNGVGDERWPDDDVRLAQMQREFREGVEMSLADPPPEWRPATDKPGLTHYDAAAHVAAYPFM